MPKEIVPFNSFNGAAPAIPDAPGGAVSFWNARVDGSLNTAVPWYSISFVNIHTNFISLPPPAFAYPYTSR